jgi:DNA modification methylase
MNQLLNKVILGDCLELFPLLEDKSVDYTFTSPPYNRLRNDKYSHFVDQNKNWLE